MQWVGGVKRHWPLASIARHWSCRSRLSEGELPFAASSAAWRAMQKPIPGEPSKHLLDEATTASKVSRRASSAMAPKALMASMSSPRP